MYNVDICYLGTLLLPLKMWVVKKREVVKKKCTQKGGSPIFTIICPIFMNVAKIL